MKLKVVVEEYDGTYFWWIDDGQVEVTSTKQYSRKHDCKVGAYRWLWKLNEKLTAGDIRCIDNKDNPV